MSSSSAATPVQGPSRGWDRPVLVVLLFLAAAVRWYHIDAASLWLDELAQLLVAERGLAGLPERLLVHAGVPVDYLVSMAMLALGRQEFWLRFAPAAFSILTLPVLYQLGRRMLGAQAALVAVALLAISPLAVKYAQEVRPYAAFGFWSVVASFLLVVSLQRDRAGWWLGFAVASFVNLHTHLFALALLAVHGGWLALLAVGGIVLRHRQAPQSWAWRWTRRRWLFAGMVFALLAAVVLFSPWMPNYVGDVIGGFLGSLGVAEAPAGSASGPVQANGISEFSGDLLREIIVALSAGGSGSAVSAIYLALAGLGAVASLRRKPASTLLLVLWLVAGPLLVIALLASRQARFNVRYLIFAQPAYLLLIGQGVASIGYVLGRLVRRQSIRDWAAWGVPLLGAGLLVFFTLPGLGDYYGRESKGDWRGVAGFLESVLEPEDDFGTAQSLHHFLAFYLPEIRDQRKPLDSPADLSKLTGERIWLLDTPFNDLLSRPQAQEWLERNRAVRLRFPPKLTLYYVTKTGDPLADVEAWLADGTVVDEAEWEERLAEIYLEQARQHLDAGRSDEARAASQRAAILAEGTLQSPARWLELAQLLDAVGEAPAAIPWYERFLERRPSLNDVRVELARAYLETGQYAASEQQARRVLEPEGTSYVAQIILAQSLAAQGLSEYALVAYETARLMQPQRSDAYQGKADLLGGQGDLMAVAEVYRQWLALVPDSPEALHGLARALEGVQDMAGALQAWQRYLQVAPDGPHAAEARERIAALSG